MNVAPAGEAVSGLRWKEDFRFDRLVRVEAGEQRTAESLDHGHMLQPLAARVENLDVAATQLQAE